MKKIVLLVLLVFVLTGCTPIKNKTINNIIDEAVSSKLRVHNVIRNGYKFYAPRGLKLVESINYNEKMSDNVYDYYLYIDLVSFYKNVKKEYVINEKSFYSNVIEKDDKFGYLEINKYQKDKYLIEIMYNYAKIEVIVEEVNLNRALTYAMSVLSSLEYNKNVLDNMIGDNILQFSEVEFDIFETHSSDGNFLDYEENSETLEEILPDMDLVK